MLALLELRARVRRYGNAFDPQAVRRYPRRLTTSDFLRAMSAYSTRCICANMEQ